MRRNHVTSLLFYTLVMLAVAHTAAADTLTVHWDPSSDPDTTGYYLYIGTTPGKYTYRFDVGGATSYAFSGAVAGKAYYFSASSYNASRVEGYPTAEVIGFSNAPPVLTNPGTQATAPGVAARLQLLGSDAYGDPLTYKATGLPAGLTVGATTGLIAGTPSTIGTYLVTATVSDGLFSAVQAFTWTVGSTSTKPTLAQPANQATTIGVAAKLQLVATDPAGKTIAYGSTVLPAGLALSTATGLISGTPTSAGTASITVTASNGTLSDTKTFTWAVNSTSTNKPPTLANPVDQSNLLGVSAKLVLSATDPEGKAMTYSATGLPGGLTLGATTGVITGKPTTAGTFAVTVTAKDGVMTSTPAYFKWTVVPNKAPLLTTPASQTSVVGVPLKLQIVASDPEGQALTFKSANLPSGVSIDSATGLISGTPGAAGSVTVTVSVSDGVTTKSANFAWTVSPDRTAPVITIGTPTVNRTTKTVALAGTATDNVSVKSVTWSTSRGSALATGTTKWSASVPLVTGTNVITIKATDGSGNVGTKQISVVF